MKKSETWKVVVCLAVFAVFAFFHVRLGCQLLRRWCLRRSIPEHPYDTVSRLRYQLVMESFAKYFLLASLTVVFLLAALYHRLTCRLDYMYWFAVSLVCMIAQIYTVVVIEDLKFFEELPDSAFENGHIDRENIKQIREQKAKDRNRVYREERQRNCSACRDKCRICFRPLPPPP